MKLTLLALPTLALVTACSSYGFDASDERVYVVEASGGAWGAGTLARAAMESIGDIEDLHMSGARAVFTVEEGEQVTRQDLAAAFEERGMQVTSFGEQRRPRAKALYTVDAGITWAATAGKVREALIAKTGAIDVYFEDEIEILIENPDQFSRSAVEEILAEMEVEYTAIEEASWGETQAL